MVFSRYSLPPRFAWRNSVEFVHKIHKSLKKFFLPPRFARRHGDASGVGLGLEEDGGLEVGGAGEHVEEGGADGGVEGVGAEEMEVAGEGGRVAGDVEEERDAVSAEGGDDVGMAAGAGRVEDDGGALAAERLEGLGESLLGRGADDVGDESGLSVIVVGGLDGGGVALDEDASRVVVAEGDGEGADAAVGVDEGVGAGVVGEPVAGGGEESFGDGWMDLPEAACGDAVGVREESFGEPGELWGGLAEVEGGGAGGVATEGEGEGFGASCVLSSPVGADGLGDEGVELGLCEGAFLELEERLVVAQAVAVVEMVSVGFEATCGGFESELVAVAVGVGCGEGLGVGEVGEFAESCHKGAELSVFDGEFGGVVEVLVGAAAAASEMFAAWVAASGAWFVELDEGRAAEGLAALRDLDGHVIADGGAGDEDDGAVGEAADAVAAKRHVGDADSFHGGDAFLDSIHNSNTFIVHKIHKIRQEIPWVRFADAAQARASPASLADGGDVVGTSRASARRASGSVAGWLGGRGEGRALNIMGEGEVARRAGKKAR